MGTSVAMIEKHYSHLSVLQKHRQLAALGEDLLKSSGHGDFIEAIKQIL